MLPCGAEKSSEYLYVFDAVDWLTIAMMNSFGFIFLRVLGDNSRLSSPANEQMYAHRCVSMRRRKYMVNILIALKNMRE